MESPAAKRQRVGGENDQAERDSGAFQVLPTRAATDGGKLSEQQQMAAVFGETQGPAGSAVSEDPRGPADSSSAPGEGLRPPQAPDNSEVGTMHSGEEQLSGFEPGIVAIEDKLHNGDLAGLDAALTAFDQAKNAGTSEKAVFDALEEAENKYEDARGEAQTIQGGMAQRLSQRLEVGSGASLAPSAGLRKNGSKGAVHIEHDNRKRIREKMLASMQKSAFAHSMDAEQQNREVHSLEDTIHQTCSSRSVYFSKAGNMSRLLGRMSCKEDLDELPRIASGLSKQVTQGITAGIAPREDVTGLQGVIPD